jgi:ATP-binding cassette subfamily B protein
MEQDWRKTRVKNTDVVRMFWGSLKPWSGSFFVAVFAVVCAAMTEVLYPVFYKRFFDTLTAPGATPEIVPTLLGVIFTVLLIRGIGWASWRTATFFHMHYEAFVMARIKDNAFEYILRHSQTFFSNSFVGALVQKINKAARAFEVICDSLIWNFLPLLIKIIGYTVVLAMIRPIFAIVVGAWAIFFVGFNYFFAIWKMKYDIARAEADSRTTGVLADVLTNHTTVDFFSRHKSENRYFRSVSGDQRRITRFSWFLSGYVEAIQGALIVGVEFCVFYFGIKLWSTGSITIGTFVLVQAYIISLTDSLWEFGKVVRKFYEAFADGQELAQIIHTPHEIIDVPGASDLVVDRGAIDFNAVGFSYGNNLSVLDDFTMHIRPGERVALVGASGAGKSTIISLLLRFHDVKSGSITIDGTDIKDVTQDSLHDAIAMVPQDTILFHRTLRENIRYGRSGATDSEVLAAAQAAHCDDFIARLPEGYDTYVGERGVKLSGGERQRVAIARAILKASPILVLDEATSSLDSESEGLIQDALAKVMEGRTTLVIAHRLSTIRRMDRIIVMQEGKVVEEGSHDALLANPDSFYKKLWDLQAGGFITEDDAPAYIVDDEDTDEPGGPSRA